MRTRPLRYGVGVLPEEERGEGWVLAEAYWPETGLRVPARLALRAEEVIAMRGMPRIDLPVGGHRVLVVYSGATGDVLRKFAYDPELDQRPGTADRRWPS